MKERPILFSGPMVRALLDGRKTQTRRVVKLPHNNSLGTWEPTTIGGPEGGRTASGETVPLQGAIWHTRTGDSLMCPYGQPGDRLWVRETFFPTPESCGGGWHYKATEANDFLPSMPWKPSIHMPRAASRITLEVTGVRVERLQTISRGDSMDEGCPFPNIAGGDDPRQWFSGLWCDINGAESWDVNPWVWVVEFRRLP
ncbi:hypothetical protein [Paraburkholderia caribensis]|uniref:hypothetical protein n=1 Tax=Paraburkholderia caribensis TaxID=75105 RepID=UPI00285CC767|nr:hypothetical protein [Paraburkholderia caribensis]MDR6381776.1 hypothetical protein [Paraburkholderia caribensis]